MADMENLVIVHQPQASRFETWIDGQVALCGYRLQCQLLILHHTEVPHAFEGQGIAAALVKTTLNWAREQGFKVRPSCSYVAAYMQRHPETQDLLAA